MKSIVIGIAGTAKNTGKTTTTSAIMDQIKKDPNLKLGLTSIGYDGEVLDNVTGLPKPRIEVWPGVLVAVAEKCLAVSKAKIEVLKKTDISTPLGKIIIGNVIQGGSLLVAGPNKSKELKQVLDLLRQQKANFIIVDGALNRIAPMVEVDGLILATGAARTPDIAKLALETKSIVEILQYPVLEAKETAISMDSILDTKAVDKMLANFNKVKTVDIQGIIGEKSFEYLTSQCDKLAGKELIFSDPIKLLVCSDINNMYQLLNQLKKARFEIGVKKSINIIAVTVNPYYPQYRFSNDDYKEAYVNKEELYETVKNNISVSIHDVVVEGGQRLFREISKYWDLMSEKVE